jgi:hypothetical protein
MYRLNSVSTLCGRFAHNLILSTSSCVSRPSTLVVRVLSCAAIS